MNFDIYKGETFSLVGESGSGKTTIGRAITRINPTSAGEIYFKGKKINGKISKELDREVIKSCQMIFQDPMASLNERAKVDYIVSEGLLNFHMYKDEADREAKVQKALREVGLLPEFASRFPHEFSGGQRQRIGIARALALEPKLIICDEAVSALDVSVQAQVLNLLQELKERLGLTYFFISHNLNVVYQVSDRVGVMYLGKMVEIAAYDQLYEKRYHPYTEALLSAIPQDDADDRTERIHLTGEVPSPSDPPSGCPFHTRCPKACDICSKEIPQLKEIEKGHFVACHLYQ